MKLSLVSYLDPESSREIRAIQTELSGITGSKASLNSWEPHVTVGDAIEVSKEELADVKERIKELCKSTSSFQLRLQGIESLDNWMGGAGETPYVIYLNVQLNNELDMIDKEVADKIKDYDKWYVMPKPYLPHCTLAFRDLTEQGYVKGLEYLQETDPRVTAHIDHIALVEKLADVDRELIRFNFIK